MVFSGFGAGLAGTVQQKTPLAGGVELSSHDVRTQRHPPLRGLVRRRRWTNIVIMARFVSNAPVHFQQFLIAGRRVLSLPTPEADVAPRQTCARDPACR
jgi:hypothetical protein